MDNVVSFPNGTLPETELIPPAVKALALVQELEGVSRTDAINRALQVYAEVLTLREEGLTIAGVGQPRGLFRRRRCTGIHWTNPRLNPTED